MTGLILKLSYNVTRDKNVTGGICGTFFFLRPDLAITANHVLNNNSFTPNVGFKKYQYWLIIQPDIVIELSRKSIIVTPEIDATFIKLNQPQNIAIRNISKNKVALGEKCFNEGFKAETMPKFTPIWVADRIKISRCNYSIDNVRNGSGVVKSLQPMTLECNDICLNNINILGLSYSGVAGMSGGPLILDETNEIVGLMSFGLPPDNLNKEQLFAIDIREVEERLKNLNI